ncbi:uncharacterized protein LOC120836413 isoform X4 [Ixodes scapularis]|uniref:uncharacterized protein LOC120836413 isoform X4 n=1 Tax=Ixodes scapularis TaxID=6945 RepID=UPI001A9E0802|nr:uncharacterized protein LOC120836413 isoform X4 [Ixodes scapularis]
MTRYVIKLVRIWDADGNDTSQLWKGGLSQAESPFGGATPLCYIMSLHECDRARSNEPQMHKTLVTTYDRRRSGQSSAVTTWFTSPSGRKQSQCHLSAATGTIRSLAPSLRLHRPRRLLQREQLSPGLANRKCS